MQHRLFITLAVIVAFVAGFLTSRIPSPAGAAPMPMTPQLIDIGAITLADLPAATSKGSAPQRMLVAQEGGTVQVQIGPVQKHYHADANEVQYVVDGTGTEWLGDKQMSLKPGDMLIIPKGTPHGGSTETSGHLKIIAFKTPPQASTDVHPLP